MKIAFFDIEVNVNSKQIEKLGLLVDELKVTETSIKKITDIFNQKKPNFICGHNFIDHDKKYLSNSSFNPLLENTPIIDTLFLSMLLYPNKKTHKLDKPYKTELNIENQPLGDAEQTKELFNFLCKKFDLVLKDLQSIYIYLLFENIYFSAFFRYKNFQYTQIDIFSIIKTKISCTKSELDDIIKTYPIELAFAIAFIFSDRESAISSVILVRYPKVVDILKILTFNKKMLNLESFAQNEFNILSFRDFEVQDENKEDVTLFSKIFNTNAIKKISQRDIINNSLDDSSILAILPTGGGKTFTFQLPALIKAKAYKGLSVVISPLQALMKNHVDSFKEKNQNFRVVAISGYLSPIERMNIITEIENGVVDVLYLAPEALRSNSIFNALKKRVIERFIIDEAHCFSSWGHDFRHDYYFIADTIKELENASKFQPKIPVSCFTATAKPEVIKDIKRYFSDKLSIELKEFIASTKRYNLEYRAIEVQTKKDKYEMLIKELQNIGSKPTIIYIPQNARECRELSEKLSNDERLCELDLVIEPFYAKIDDEVDQGQRQGRKKSEILNDFIDNKINIVVATTAFGMGIDKPDIQAVIHYEQSDSLEAYLQESGRGARDEKLKAQCIVLYSKDDFNKMFTQLNHSKIDYHEIERIVKELKSIKRDEIYISPKQLAQKMGIDTEDSKIDYEAIIKTALLELEHANIIKRGRNGTKIFATSTINKEKRNMAYVHNILDNKKDEYEKIYNYMILVMQNIIQRSKVDAIEVDDLADIVGIGKKDIFDVLYALQKEKLLEFNNDISIFAKKSVLNEFEKHFELEKEIFGFFTELDSFSTNINLRDINSKISDRNIIKEIKKIIQSWKHLSKLKANNFNAHFHKDICHFKLDSHSALEKMIDARKKTCGFIIEQVLKHLEDKDEAEIEISTNRLKVEFDDIQKLTLEGFHHSIVYLHEMLKDFKLRRGRLIYYQTFKLDKQDNINQNTPYKKREHYNKSLKPYYERKIEAIHIQIVFLKKLLKDGWEKTLSFVQDYFTMEYEKFKKKYGFIDKEIKLPITQEKLREILYDLNDEQKRVFEDRKSSSIMVLAGPGSGKTKTLVHKIASLITIENNKSEYFLMLAHSRVAVAEFKERLYKLIGSQAYDMKIFTFHAFAVHLVGKKIDERTHLHDVIEIATKMLQDKIIELPYIQMLVLDEYQDVGSKTYSFIKTIYESMSKDKKIIAVGDDDQCINNFGDDRADIFYISEFKKDFQDFIEEDNYQADQTILFSETESGFSQYSLLTNYRSKKNIVELANEFNQHLPNRLKIEKLISHSKEDGDINITFYKDTNYIENIVNEVINDKSEYIAILARSNDEVLTIYSQLIANKIKAKYITSKDGFNLGNLIELRDFLSLWESSNFEDARVKIDKKYQNSKNYSLVCNVIDTFFEQYEDEIQKSEAHFQAVFSEYLKEIEFDEFEQSRSNVIVSTMHKAKGKEFDSVYVCVQDDFIKNEYDRRLLYVALTRAKNRLNIHTKDRILKFINLADRVVEYDKKVQEPNRIVFEMGLGDIMLSNDYAQQGIIKTNTMAGDKISIIQKEGGIFELIKDGFLIARLSKIDVSKPDRLSTKISQMQSKDYILENEAEVEHVVEWFDKKDKKIYLEVLSRVYMSKNKNLGA